jgi:hypothetical protein
MHYALMIASQVVAGIVSIAFYFAFFLYEDEESGVNKRCDSSMKRYILVLLSCLLLPALALAQSPSAAVTLDLHNKLGPMKIDRFSLGQGGFSSEPTFRLEPWGVTMFSIATY